MQLARGGLNTVGNHHSNTRFEVFFYQICKHINHIIIIRIDAQYMQTYRRKSHTSQGTLYGNSTLTKLPSSYIKHIKKSIKSSSITPMGQGGFGSIYHIVLTNKSEVAVKLISRKLNESWKSFKQRVKNEYLCQWVCTGHANVVGAVKLMYKKFELWKKDNYLYL